MFCEKCGKDVPKGAEVCNKCGAKMPGNSACGGFADILSFEETAGDAMMKPDTKSAGHEMEIRRLTEKVNLVAKRSKSAILISLGTAGLCILLMAVALTFSVISLSKTNKANHAEPGTSIEAPFEGKQHEQGNPGGTPGTGEGNSDTTPGTGEGSSDTTPGSGDENSDTTPGSGDENSDTTPGSGKGNSDANSGADNSRTTEDIDGQILDVQDQINKVEVTKQTDGISKQMG